MKIPSSCCRDSLMISFSFVLYSVGISQYLDYSFSAVQDNCNMEKNATHNIVQVDIQTFKNVCAQGLTFHRTSFLQHKPDSVSFNSGIKPCKRGVDLGNS